MWWYFSGKYAIKLRAWPSVIGGFSVAVVFSLFSWISGTLWCTCSHLCSSLVSCFTWFAQDTFSTSPPLSFLKNLVHIPYHLLKFGKYWNILSLTTYQQHNFSYITFSCDIFSKRNLYPLFSFWIYFLISLFKHSLPIYLISSITLKCFHFSSILPVGLFTFEHFISINIL